MKAHWRAALAAALVVAACGRPAGERTIRLVEAGESASARWPFSGHRPPPQGLRISDLGSLPAPGAVVDVIMYDGDGDYDSRAAVALPRGGRYRFELEAPAGSELRLALGYVVPENPDGEMRYMVRAAPQGENGEPGEFETLLDEAVPLRAKGSWLDRTIPLDRWAGRPIVLELRVPGRRNGERDTEWAAFANPEILPRRPERLGPNVILISLDTLRADHLGCYGYERPTSPNLDRLAQGGFRFATAISQAPWTRPSHRAMLRGQYPLSHGPTVTPQLPLTLWKEGYRTGAITGGGQISFRFGFHEGFETFRQTDWVRTLSDVTEWLDEQPERSFFLLLHTFEIHDPYGHAELAEGLPSGRIKPGFGKSTWWKMRDSTITPEERTYIEALYDSGIRFTDDALGRLFEALDDRGILDRSIVVVTSDHGEQFWEHGSWRHGGNVFEEMIHVPLIVHLPPGLTEGRPGRVVRQQVSSIDIVPTVLDLLGMAARRAPRDAASGRCSTGPRRPTRPPPSASTPTSRARARACAPAG
ncbi:MAG: sulfatase [Thermoanaerobaculia bacterium]